MSVYCQFYDNKQNKISEVIVSNASFSIPANAVAGLFYDNTYKLDGLKLTLNNLTANDFSFDFAKDYFLYVFPVGYSSILATSVRSSSLMSGVPELSQNDIEYLKNLSDNSAIDLSTIVTALNSITTALSALTNLSNLSNLADLANIITAIQNKDNQSDLVSKLDNIFFYTANSKKRNIISGQQSTHNYSSDWDTQNYSFFGLLHKLICVFSTLNAQMYSSPSVYTNNNKYFGIISSLLSAGGNPNAQNSYSNIQNLSLLKTVSDNLQNIETKLEQNLPFTTIVENDIVETNVAQNCSYGSKIEQIPFTE